MRRQYGHSCGSFIPPLVGGGIRNCDDDDDDAAETTAPCGPANWIGG